ncbi:asparagine synthetase B family protein [Niabella aquatica]
MSLVFGTWQYTEKQYTEKSPLYITLEYMYNGLAGLPQESHSFRALEQVGFGHILTLNTPQAIYEQMPVYLPERQLLLVTQGRIDNRDRLFNSLAITASDSFTDGQLMIHAYLKWEKECVHHLRGDWSFAVFDYKEQELFIARDPMGYTSLYYYQDDTGFYFGSSVKGLLALPRYKKQLNEEHWLRALTLWDHTSRTVHTTFFENIYSLPVAHTLTVKKDRSLSTRKYWQPQNSQLLHYKNKQDYATEMLDIFTGAVQSRLRSYKPVASMLSGGLDSSTVSFVTADLLKLKNKRLVTFSHVPLYASELWQDKGKENRVLDETPLILQIVEASGNIDPLLLNSKNGSVLKGMLDFMNISDAPAHAAANLFWLQDLYGSAVQQGFGALLSGEGGNGSISFAGSRSLLPLSWKMLANNPYPYFRSRIAKPLVKTFLPGYFEKRKRSNNKLKRYISSVFVQESVLHKYDIVNDLLSNDKDFQRTVKDIAEVKETFITLYNTRSLFGAAYGQYYGFELRDPCADQDVMEYHFRIPNDAFFDARGNNRMLVKRMMRNRIPDSVLFEKRAGLQSADITYRVKAQHEEITNAIDALQQSAAASHYIDIKKLEANWKLYLTQPYTDSFSMQCLLKGLEFALFLQLHFD